MGGDAQGTSRGLDLTSSTDVTPDRDAGISEIGGLLWGCFKQRLWHIQGIGEDPKFGNLKCAQAN